MGLVRLAQAVSIAWFLCVGAAEARTTAETNLISTLRELVEIDSSEGAGGCTRIAEAMRSRLRLAGFGENEAQVIAPEADATQGNLVAIFPGVDANAGAVLLLAHIDVVAARRADWSSNPFTLVEDEGVLYGRGVADDKAMAAVFVDMLVAMRQSGYRPRRSIKLALTCGEETPLTSINGVSFLLDQHRSWLEADFAINEGGGGVLDASGRPVMLELQVSEKIPQTFVLEVRNPGGHSSAPRPDNAIYELSEGLIRLSRHRFAVSLNETTRAQLAILGPRTEGAVGAALSRLSREPNDRRAAMALAQAPHLDALIRTTCVATRLDAGHANNALAQRARATISCRILPGQSVDAVEAELVRVLDDPQISITREGRAREFVAPVLTEEVLGPVRAVSAEMWPGVAVVPIMLLGATDGRFLNAAGIPTYGISGMFSAPGETNAHGANERLRVQSLFEGRRFLETLVRRYVQ